MCPACEAVSQRTRDERDVHLFAVYAVSSPVSTAAKRKLNADLYHTIAVLLDSYCGRDACLAALDLNTVPDGADRKDGEQEPYDRDKPLLIVVAGCVAGESHCSVRAEHVADIYHVWTAHESLQQPLD